jgi:hypothetical protein
MKALPGKLDFLMGENPRSFDWEKVKLVHCSLLGSVAFIEPLM